MKKKIMSIIVIKSQNKIQLVRTEDISFIKCDANYIEIRTSDGKKITVCMSLTECYKLIDHNIFYKVCAHYVINIFKITEYIKAGRKLKFGDDLSIIIPEDRVADFNKMLEERFIVL
jgi:two-component system, LytTR family, response regulator